MPQYLRVFFWYTFLTTSILGVVIIYFFDFSFGRVDEISSDVKNLIFYHVFYSVFLIFISIYFSCKLVAKSNVRYFRLFISESPYRYKKISIILLFLNTVYLLLLSILYLDSIPLYSILAGVDLNETLALAKKSHSGLNSYNIPYVSKFFDFSNLFTPLLILIIFIKGGSHRFLLIFSYIVSFLYLSLDLQKAPFLMLCIISMYLSLVFSSGRIVLLRRVFYSFVLGTIVLFLYSFFMNKDFLNMVLYLLDRPIFGQAQGMYYIYEYYPVSFEAMFSKSYFHALTGTTIVPPDVYIASYVYPDNENIVNVNTFFIGEAWGFGGNIGVYFFTLIVAFSISFYILFWTFMFRFYTHITYLMSIVFFATLPINQSLQFIIYQKYFLYFVLFFMVPVFFICMLIKLLRFR